MAGYCYENTGISGTDATPGSVEGSAPSGQGITATIFNITPFSLTPDQSNFSVFIYYKSGTGIKIFNSATEKIPDTFDGEYKGMELFNDKLQERDSTSGWRETGYNIVIINNAKINPRNIIYKYIGLTVEYINNHTITYTGQNIRRAIISTQMYHCS